MRRIPSSNHTINYPIGWQRVKFRGSARTLKSPFLQPIATQQRGYPRKIYSFAIVLLKQILNFTAECFTVKLIIKKLMRGKGMAFLMFCQDILHAACQTMG